MSRSNRTGTHAAMELASRVYNQPIAIDADSLKFFTWARADVEDIETWMAISLEKFGQSENQIEDGVAIIPIRGSLFRGTFFDDYEVIGDALDAAVANPEVHAIMLEVDSPGGEVRGMFDLAGRIRNARGTKPIVALADDQATSAAYALASAADEIVASPTATIGSIGVVAAHVDTSSAADKAGVKITEVSSGQQKTALSSNQPLSQIGRGILEKAVNSAASQFFDLVSENRGIPVDQVREQEAAVYFGQEAVDAGLADRVGSRSEVLQGLASFSSAPGISSSSLLAENESSTVTVTVDAPPIQNQRTEEKPTMAESQETPTEVIEDNLEEQVETAVVEPSVEGAEVVDLDAARAEGREAATAEAQEIIDLCTIAGRPASAASFIASGKSVEGVRSELLEAKVNEVVSEIDNSVDASASSGEPQIELDPYAIIRSRREQAEKRR